MPSPIETAAPSPVPEAPSFAPETSAAVGGSTFAYGGYIDSAIIRSQIRLRYDSAYDNNRPDRAEFFYAKCGCNPGGRGPRELESRVDYQDINTYIEFAASNRLSGFIEVPVRFLNPDMNDNTAGLSDITAGVRLGLIANPGQAYTFQLRAYAPTGDDDRGLGTGHASLEPAFLVFQKLTDRLYVEGEFRDWIPIGGTDFAGNVLRYGVGMAYNVAPSPERQFIAPVVEFVGWTVLGGKQTVFPTGVIEALPVTRSSTPSSASGPAPSRTASTSATAAPSPATSGTRT